MKVLTKAEFIELIRQHPEGGIVFNEYEPDYYKGDLMVTVDGSGLGATLVVPWKGEVYCWDWAVDADYEDKDLFAVFDDEDVLQMIHTLTHRGEDVKLNYDNRFFKG